MKWLRIAAAIAGGLFALLFVLLAVLWWNGGRRLGHRFDVTVAPIAVPSDSASIAEGERLTKIFGCVACHDAGLRGRVMIEAPNFARVIAPQLAPGPTSATRDFTTEDWARAIRYGLHKDRRPIVIMPAVEFQTLADSDIGRIIAYATHLPPLTHELPKTEVRMVARMLIGAGALPIEAEQVEPARQPAEPVRGATAEYGRYLAATCRVCHGPNLGGVADPSFGGPDITGGGATAGWTFDDFSAALRTGRTPDGRSLDDERMPWTSLGFMTDDELTAVWLYIQSVPPAAAAR